MTTLEAALYYLLQQLRLALPVGDARVKNQDGQEHRLHWANALTYIAQDDPRAVTAEYYHGQFDLAYFIR